MNQINPGMTYNPVILNKNFWQAFENKLINIVAPASGIAIDSLDKLKQIPHLSVHFPPHLIENHISFHANTDEARFLYLKQALYDDALNTIIWTLRGGYGSARLIDQLMQLTPPKQEKIFIGFSDNTALHLFFSQQWGWKTIHGCGFSQLLDLKQSPENYLRLADLILKRVPQQTFNLSPMNPWAKQMQTISGFLQGGNITLVEASIGTSWEIQTDHAILLLEEVGEKGYRIDRSLNHLRQAGLLKHVQAIIFGECLGEDKTGIATALERFAKESQVPVFQCQQFGHGEVNFPWVYQASAEICIVNNEIVLNMQMEMTK